MSNILETIDNAVKDWETSPDAMRWTPESPQPPKRAKTPAIAEMTPEQVAAVWEQFRVSMQATADHLARLWRNSIQPAIRALAKDPAIRALIKAHASHRRRPAHITAMRVDYRRKTRNRR